jgi:hypothetical protein
MSETDFVARGKVKGVQNGLVVFIPAGTTYELHLNGAYDGAIGELIDCFVRVKARKVYTVPSGGNFIVPIFGPPRIVQGRVRWGTDQRLVVHASIPVIVDLPGDESAIDLDEGGIAVGKMVNAVLLPGASFELAAKPAAR